MILCGCENLIDFIQQPGGGTTQLFRAVPGGSPYNFCKALARQGVRVGYLTPFSSDALGERLATGLAAEGVELLGGRSDGPTCLAMVTVADGQPSYQFYREGTADRDITLPRLRAAIPADAKALHIGSIALAGGPDAYVWEALFTGARDAGLLTTLDPNVRPMVVAGYHDYRARLDRLMSTADLIKLSDEDLRWISPDADLDSAASAIFDAARPGLLILTKGGDGAVGWARAGKVAVPAAPVRQIVDTVGAGDTFMAKLLAGLAHREALSRTALEALPLAKVDALMAEAARAAAVTCSREGCDPPYLADLA
jgi:fructokinase